MDATTEIKFSNNWFDVTARAVWDGLVPRLNPRKVLEIGSFEGASACYLIERANEGLELHCVDTWEGGDENKTVGENMSAVEMRFYHNTKNAVANARTEIELVPHKGRSDDELAKMLASGRRSYFDMIYIDGSHYAHDAMTDAVLSFPLLRIGGHMFFDDYLWRGSGGVSVTDPLSGPKPGVDGFLNVFFHKMRLLWSQNSQVVAIKIAE